MKTAKLMIKLALVIAVAAFCSGYFGKSYQQNTAEYVVREGDTLWYVAGQYFGKEERTDHFGELQWGTYSVPWISHGGSTSHSWPISFNSSCFAAIGIAKSSAADEWRNTNEISAVTTNSFTWNRSYEEAGSFMAFAIGQ